MIFDRLEIQRNCPENDMQDSEPRLHLGLNILQRPVTSAVLASRLVNLRVCETSCLCRWVISIHRVSIFTTNSFNNGE